MTFDHEVFDDEEGAIMTTLTEHFQPQVAAFLHTLREFANGTYLQQEERDRWDQPFDPSALEELQRILTDFLQRLDHELPRHAREDQGTDASGLADSFDRVVADLERAIERLNARYAGAVVEPEEEAELNELVSAIATKAGIDPAASARLPMFE